MVEKNIEQIWQDLLSEASTRLPQGAADLWLKTCIPVEILGDSLVLDVPNVFVKEQISSRFLKDLTVLVKERGIAGAVEFRVGSETRKDEQVRAERAEIVAAASTAERVAQEMLDRAVVEQAGRHQPAEAGHDLRPAQRPARMRQESLRP